jgi:hypothetical protein
MTNAYSGRAVVPNGSRHDINAISEINTVSKEERL